MLTVGFYLLLALLIALIYSGLQNMPLPAETRRKYVRGFALATTAWLAYMYAMDATGVLQIFTPPPRIVVFLILPAFAAIAWFFFSNKFETLIRAIPPAWPVYLQAFRIGVELLILGVYLKGLGSIEPTLEGYNFDMLAGLTAPFVAYFVFQRKAAPKKAALAWNIFGLLLLANVVIIFNTLFLKPELWGYATSPIKPEFGTMPYLLIPGLYMPLAVFLHFFSIAQLKRLTIN